LTEKENKKIRKMNLPPKVEAEVRDVWQGQAGAEKTKLSVCFIILFYSR